MTCEEYLAEVKVRVQNATPDLSGELGKDWGWHIWDCPEQKFKGVCAFEFGPSHISEHDLWPIRVADCEKEADAIFIARARIDIPRLVKMVEILTEEIKNSHDCIMEHWNKATVRCPHCKVAMKHITSTLAELDRLAEGGE